MTEQTKNQVNEVVLDMSKKIKTHIDFSAAKGDKAAIGTEKDSSFEATLPEDLDLATCRKVSEHNATFIAAGAHAFGELAVAAMKKNGDLEEASLKLKMSGRDSVDYNVLRQNEVRNPANRDAEPIIKHGTVRTTYNVKGGSNSGQLKHVRDAINQMAAEALNKK